MKSKITVFAVAAALLTAGLGVSGHAEGGAAEWRKTLECVSGEVMWISGDKNDEKTLFAGAGEGLFLSMDQGLTWQKAITPPAVTDVTRVASAVGKICFIASGSLYIGNCSNCKRVEGKTGLKGADIGELSPGREIIIAWTDKELYEVEGIVWKEIGSSSAWDSIDDAAINGGNIFVVSGTDVFVLEDKDNGWRKTQLYPGNAKEDVPDDIADAADLDDMSSEGVTGETVLTKGRIYSKGSQGVMVATSNAIYRLAVDGAIDEVIDTSGLPSKELIQAVDTPEDLFAVTSKKVFAYSGADAWTPVFEPAGDGGINFLYYGKGTGGDGYLLAASGASIYRSKVERDVALLNDPEKKVAAYSFDGEPSVVEVQKMAIEYAEVSPKKIQDWRNAAKWKAVMPKLSVDFGRDRDDNMEVYTSATTQYCYSGPDELSDGWDVGLEWDLSDLVWNAAQTSIDVRSKLMVQLRNEILEEVTRLYFERRRVIVETSAGATGKEVKGQGSRVKGQGKELLERGTWSMQEKEIRVEELTAHIDAYTGGKFSEALARGNSGR